MRMFDTLRTDVLEANLALVRRGLVDLTWGNASAVDRAEGVMAIKPSGVAYDTLSAADIVVLSLADGTVVEGALRPSSDSETHRLLYARFPGIGGVVHTHSRYAVAWAQAGRAIPCLGTTHADHFYGAIPITRALTPKEVDAHYEHATGIVIAERFLDEGIDPVAVPGVLVAGHGPFSWGSDVHDAARNAEALEIVAEMAFRTLQINPEAVPLERTLLDKHYFRKHGKSAYYGQP